MRGVTIHLDEVVEERERERRRARKVFAAAMVVALLGIAAALREPPTKTITIIKTDTVWREVECVVTTTQTERVVVPPIVIVRHHPVSAPPEVVDASTRHLCLTPKRLDFTAGIGTSDRITVSNPSQAAIAITGVTKSSDRAKSGFVVDESDCVGRMLQPGQRCVIYVNLRKRIGGETLTIAVAHDFDAEGDTMTVEAREVATAAASPATPAAVR
jgi:hypothetical protein